MISWPVFSLFEFGRAVKVAHSHSHCRCFGSKKEQFDRHTQNAMNGPSGPVGERKEKCDRDRDKGRETEEKARDDSVTGAKAAGSRRKWRGWAWLTPEGRRAGSGQLESGVTRRVSGRLWLLLLWCCCWWCFCRRPGGRDLLANGGDSRRIPVEAPRERGGSRLERPKEESMCLRDGVGTNQSERTWWCGAHSQPKGVLYNTLTRHCLGEVPACRCVTVNDEGSDGSGEWSSSKHRISVCASSQSSWEDRRGDRQEDRQRDNRSSTHWKTEEASRPPEQDTQHLTMKQTGGWPVCSSSILFPPCVSFFCFFFLFLCFLFFLFSIFYSIQVPRSFSSFRNLFYTALLLVQAGRLEG